MIIQGSNFPIVITFPEDVAEIPDIHVSLWHDKDKKTASLLKEWDKADMTTDSALDPNELYCPLTQEETAAFPLGDATIEIMSMTVDGYKDFYRDIHTSVIRHRDKTVMGD